MHDVVVIGGGIAGLSTAWELQRQGLSAIVLETADRAGGVITTDRWDDWVLDAGPDSLFLHKPAAVTLCRELGIADRLVHTLTPRTAFVLRDGRLHAVAEGSFLGFPLSVASLARSSLFTIAGRARMAAELLIPRASVEADESIAAFVRRRFGQEAADYLAEPLLAGIHAGDAERLSVQALFPRLVDAERRAGSVIRAMRALHVKPAPGGAFVSLPGGTGELVETLVAALGADRVRTNSRVLDIRRVGHYVIDTSRGPVEGRAVVLAVPAYVAGSLLRGFDASLAGLCEAIPYASIATVLFGYARGQVQHPMAGSGFVVPRVEPNALLAGTWVTSKWPGRAPADHVLLRGFLGGGRDPRRLDADDATLVALARSEFETLLGIRGEPLFARLYRWPRRSPQYEVGHLDRVATIDRKLEALPGLWLTGSGFHAIGIPDCIAHGRATATRAAQFVRGRAA